MFAVGPPLFPGKTPASGNRTLAITRCTCPPSLCERTLYPRWSHLQTGCVSPSPPIFHGAHATPPLEAPGGRVPATLPNYLPPECMLSPPRMNARCPSVERTWNPLWRGLAAGCSLPSTPISPGVHATTPPQSPPAPFSVRFPACISTKTNLVAHAGATKHRIEYVKRITS